MQNRTPPPAGPVEPFDPVPRKARHDGWTPDRQRAFIGALADTGSVTTACRMVNMSTEGAYFLRRQPGAEGFRKAWETALDCGVLRLKDEAFERAMNGQLVPVFVAGKLMGYRRKKNDRLLMFCLRHYGEDRHGRRTRIDCFEPRAEREHPDERAAEAHPHLPLTEPNPSPALPAPDPLAALQSFGGVALDAQAQAAIQSALEACAARTRAQAAQDDPDEVYLPANEAPLGFAGTLEMTPNLAEFEPFTPGEVPWTMLDDHAQLDALDAVEREMAAETASGVVDRGAAGPEPQAPAKQRSRKRR